MLHNLTKMRSSDLEAPPPSAIIYTHHCHKLEHDGTADMGRRPVEGSCTSRLDGEMEVRSRQIKSEQTCSGDKRGGVGVKKSKYESRMMSF